MPRTLFPRSCRVASSLFVGGILVGCLHGDEPTVPALSHRPSFDFTNGPTSPVVVYRGPGGFAFIADLDRQLALTAGLVTSIPEVCATGQFEVSGVTEQDLFSPTGVLHILALAREAPVVIYGGPLPDDACDLSPSAIIATGTVAFTSKENDVLRSGPGADSYTLNVNGTVTLTAGGEARLIAMTKFLRRPDGTFVPITEEIRLLP